MLDSYARSARLAPAVLAGVPAAALLSCGLLSPDRVARIAALMLGCSSLVVCGFTRDAGRRRQESLWAEWGGPPTAIRLRWRTSADPDVTLSLHRRLNQLVEEPLPSRDQELADPDGADRRYDEVVAILRERTRDRIQFPLVFAENVDYGFRRNCLGLRPHAMAIAMASLVTSIALIGFASGGLTRGLEAWGVASAVSLMMLAFWQFVVTPHWVRRAADRYAEHLLAATAVLTPCHQTFSPQAPAA